MGEIDDKEEEIFGKPGDFERNNIANAKKGRVEINISGITTALENCEGGCGLKPVQHPLDTQVIEDFLNGDKDPRPSVQISLSLSTIAELAKMAIMLKDNKESKPLNAHLVFNGKNDPEKIVYASLCVIEG